MDPTDGRRLPREPYASVSTRLEIRSIQPSSSSSVYPLIVYRLCVCVIAHADVCIEYRVSSLPCVCAVPLLKPQLQCRLRRSTIVTDTILDTYRLCLRLELKRKSLIKLYANIMCDT